MEESAGFPRKRWGSKVSSWTSSANELTNLDYIFISKTKQQHCQWGDVRRHRVRQSLGWCLLRNRQTQEAFMYRPQWGWHQWRHAVGGGKNNLALFLTVARRNIIWKSVEDFQNFALVVCGGSAAGSPVSQTQNEKRSKAVDNGPTPRHAWSQKRPSNLRRSRLRRDIRRHL